MDTEMETSPSYFDPEDLSSRDTFRRYGKRNFSPYQESRPNGALLLDEIKQEIEEGGGDYYNRFDGRMGMTPFKRRLGSVDDDDDVGGVRRIKNEDVVIGDVFGVDSGESSTYAVFASLLDPAIQGLMPFPDLILRFEETCRNVSESLRYGSSGRHRVVEDKLIRQKARLLLDEAASWSLLCFSEITFGHLAGNEELPQDLILSPTTSHLAACQFVLVDHEAQSCLRIVQWLEELASKALDLENKVKGCHVGTHLPSSGVWHQTQRCLKKRLADTSIIQHLDFDAPTREMAQLMPDDKKQDESLLEDVWTLLRAGRLEEACELCRSAGQPWRAATLCPFGGLDLFPSIEALMKNGKNRTLQAIELESRVGHQWRLWKWASYCASEKMADQDVGKYEAAIYAAQCSNLKRLLPICTDWESACWAMSKSWLDVLVDLELARLEPGRLEQLRRYGDEIDENAGQGYKAPSLGTESWPCHVLTQQPRDLPALLQKLHSSDLVHEAVSRGCKEQHRQIEMNLMVGDIPHVLDLLWSWISSSDDDHSGFRPHGDPQMIRFGAHLVLVLRYLLAGEMRDTFREKLRTVGDIILQMYAMYLFSMQHEELVGVYASQLARHHCIDLFVEMMEARLNRRVDVKYKIFLTAMEHLPFSPDDTKGSFEEIIDRVLMRSREIKAGKYDEETSDVAEQHRLQSHQKAMAIQWLCFTPPSHIIDAEVITAKLLLRALIHSNTLFREFALISMWRVPKMPIGAHMLLSFLAEPLKQPTENLHSLEDHNASENLLEFQDWREYYSCDATYRNWLKIDLENAEIPPDNLSSEERERAIAAGKETIDSSLALLLRREPWLTSSENHITELLEPVYLELHATAMLSLPTGECMRPDATSCTTLASALYSSVSEEDVLKRQLMINVSISPKDNYSIEIVLRCLEMEGDGIGRHENNDGGVLATVMAAGFKGELGRFQAGVTMEISRLDAWFSTKEGSVEGPATYVLHGLCRRCCLPEIVLRCMQVSVSLADSGSIPENHDELIELVASDESGLLHLFSQQQLQGVFNIQNGVTRGILYGGFLDLDRKLMASCSKIYGAWLVIL
ncbi:hypothetical protein C5167_026821 [Papaver somniferum]|nr:hypothetical protein C5167_026821 [Papaver somniferum]